MIRDEHEGLFLRCMLEELNTAVRPELNTDYARKVVDSLMLVLGRLVAEYGPVREIAATRVDLWRSLTQQLLSGSTMVELPAGNPLQQLDGYVSQLQQRLSDAQYFDDFVDSLRSGSAASRTWFDSTALALNDLYQNIENSFQWPVGRKGASSVGDNIDDTRERLAAYLHRRFPELPENPILKLSIVTGGQIKRTALLQLVPNDVLPIRLVLRQDMPHNFTGSVVTDEYVTIARVFELGLPVPQPILVEADASILGGQFMIMTEVENALPAGTYFPEERAVLGHSMGPEFGHEVAGVLARLHRLTLKADGQAGIAATQQRKDEIEALQQRWRDQQSKPAFYLGMELGLAWLLAHPLDDDRPRCLIHGDVGAHNAMTRDGHLAALLDWELAAMGDPAYDLAQVRMMLLPDTMAWEAFAASYVRQGGPAAACDARAVAYYCVWMFVRHSSLSAGLWASFNAGARDDAAAASVASHYIDRLGLYTSRALAEAVNAQ